MKHIIKFFALAAFIVLSAASCQKEAQEEPAFSIIGDWQYLVYAPSQGQDQVTFNFHLEGELCETAPGLPTMCMGDWRDLTVDPAHPVFEVRRIAEKGSIPSTWLIDVIADNVIVVTSRTEDPDNFKTLVETFTLTRETRY